MAKSTKPKSDTKSTTKPAPQTEPSSTSPTPKTDGAMFRAANYLLSRLPWFKDRYESWTKTKRIIIGFLLYLIVLPIIPIVLAIILYIHDPEGFKKSKAFPILGALIVAQLAAFGVITQQTPKVTAPSNTKSSASVSPDKQLEASDKAAKERKKNNPSSVEPSNPTKGRYFENCTAAFDAGVNDIPKSDKSYRDPLDGDKDGVACEK